MAPLSSNDSPDEKDLSTEMLTVDSPRMRKLGKREFLVSAATRVLSTQATKAAATTTQKCEENFKKIWGK